MLHPLKYSESSTCTPAQAGLHVVPASNSGLSAGSHHLTSGLAADKNKKAKAQSCADKPGLLLILT